MIVDDYKELLQAGLFKPPPDFADRVMAKVMNQPAPAFSAPVRSRCGTVQWLALAAASLLGALELIAFVFGIWTTASAI